MKKTKRTFGGPVRLDDMTPPIKAVLVNEKKICTKKLACGGKLQDVTEFSHNSNICRTCKKADMRERYRAKNDPFY